MNEEEVLRQYKVISECVTDLVTEVKQIMEIQQTITSTLAVMNNEIQINIKNTQELIEANNSAHDRLNIIEEYLNQR